MEAFNEMIAIQKEGLKVRLEEQVIEANQAIDKFAERWRALRPTDLTAWDAASVGRVFRELDEWSAQLEDFKDRAADLAENFSSFSMPMPPRFDGLAVVDADVGRTVHSWGMLRDYLAALAALEAADWISFRNDMYALTDLATDWSDRVKARLAAEPGGDARGRRAGGGGCWCVEVEGEEEESPTSGSVGADAPSGTFSRTASVRGARTQVLPRQGL